MASPCILTVAITGSLARRRDNPAVPVTATEQIEAAHAAFEAGATVAHLHVRNEDEAPTASPQRFSTVLQGIRNHCPGMVTQVATDRRAGRGRARGGMLRLRPDMASLALRHDDAGDGAPGLVDWLASEMRQYGIQPEVEVRDPSAIEQAARMQRDGRLPGRLHARFVAGPRDALPVDRSMLASCAEALARLAPDATWTGAGLGDAALEVARWALALGGHCRIGLEDGLRFHRTAPAPSNAGLVRRVVDLCGDHDRRPATVDETRRLLGLAP